jgi:hypothetical protein
MARRSAAVRTQVSRVRRSPAGTIVPDPGEGGDEMARATWSGSISFGLVSVPVQLFTAVRSHTVHFTQLHRETGNRVRNKRVDEESGEEVAYDDIVKGYEVADGQYVVVDPDELDELFGPGLEDFDDQLDDV